MVSSTRGTCECGVQLGPTDSRFCTSCGRAVPPEANDPAVDPAVGSASGGVAGGNPPKRKSAAAWAGLGVVLVLLVVIGGVGVVRSQSPQAESAVAEPVPSTPADTESPRPDDSSPPPNALVLANPETRPGREAAAFLETYLQGINKDQWRVVCPRNETSACSDLREGVRYSQWSDVEVVDAWFRGSDLMVDFTGRTRQPRSEGRDNESCTDWSLLYRLADRGTMRAIVEGSAESTPCR